jgi:membrane-associated protease RseP (regulator of RpoE activity)
MKNHHPRSLIVALVLVALWAPTVSIAGAQAMLASARAAAGARESAFVGYLRLSGSERASGLNGRWSKLIDLATGKTRDDSNFGVFSTADVWDGHRGWHQDMSGGVHPRDSEFMRKVHVTEAWLAQFGYLRSNALGAVLKPLEDREADGRNFVVLQATPRQGQPVELWFDKDTKRLARTVQIMTIDVRTIRYDDYRQEQGLFIPFKITSDDGNAADVIQIEHIERVGAAAGDFGRPRAPDDFAIAGGKTVVPIEIAGYVIVEAMLNGQGPFAFILDTGGLDILTPEAATALGLKPVGAGTSGGSGSGTVSEQYARVDRVQIGGMTMRNQPFTVIALSYDTVERGARPRLAGILGLELFERFAMQLNYHEKTLAFEPLSGYQHRGGGIAVPIFFSENEPLLVAKIAGLSGDVGLDTGNAGTLIVQGIWADRNGLKQQMMRGYPSLGFGMGGASSNWTSRVDFEIAGHRFEGIIARYAADTKGAFSSRTESGNVGNDILANFTLGFDYGRGQIWFEPAPSPEQRPFARAGVSVSKERAEAFKVVAVAAGSPAADAGLEVGDEIVAIDGTPANQLSGWDFRRTIRLPPGTKVMLSIVRAGQSQAAELILKELLP